MFDKLIPGLNAETLKQLTEIPAFISRSIEFMNRLGARIVAMDGKIDTIDSRTVTIVQMLSGDPKTPETHTGVMAMAVHDPRNDPVKAAYDHAVNEKLALAMQKGYEDERQAQLRSGIG